MVSKFGDRRGKKGLAINEEGSETRGDKERTISKKRRKTVCRPDFQHRLQLLLGYLLYINISIFLWGWGN